MPDRVSACGGDLFGGMREALDKKEEEKNPSGGGRTQSPGMPQGIAKVIPTRSALDIQGEWYPNAICGSLEG